MVSAPAERTGVPTARRLIFCAADRYRSSSVGESPPTLMLSNPWLESSLGSSVSTSTSSAEQIADRVLIFRAIQAAERIGAAGIRIRRRHAVERRFEVRDEPVVGRFGRPRTPRRRHRPRAQLAHHELPPLGIGSDVRDVERAKSEIPLLGFFVMTAGAITIQRCLFRRRMSATPGGQELPPVRDEPAGRRPQ